MTKFFRTANISYSHTLVSKNIDQPFFHEPLHNTFAVIILNNLTHSNSQTADFGLSLELLSTKHDS